MTNSQDNFTIDYTSTHVVISMAAADVKPASYWAGELFDTGVDMSAPEDSVTIMTLDDGSIQIRVLAEVWNRWGMETAKRNQLGDSSDIILPHDEAVTGPDQ